MRPGFNRVFHHGLHARLRVRRPLLGRNPVARAGPSERYHPPVNRLASTTVPGGSSKASNPVLDRLAYRYFLWRKDTISDLVLFALLNVLFIGLVSVAAQALRFGDSLSLYAIGQIVVGQELPEESTVSLAEQVFAFAVGIFGLSSFAVVLALVEQAVLEVLESNVRQGSTVIEEGHVVLLSWGTSNRDLAQTIRIVKEICGSQQYSWIKEGRLSVVVLSQGREKLEMESIFDGALPESQRAGCRLVFRKGSPLDPLALDMVSVATAKMVIISGDYSARCRESDAQVLRSAILVDELLQETMGTREVGAEWGVAECAGGIKVVAELQTREGLELCNDTCSILVRAVATTTINAMRTARLLWHPTASVVSHSLFDHNSTCFIGVCRDPDERFRGMTIKELGKKLPYATPFGFVNLREERYDINPRPNRTLQAGESIVLLQSAERDAAILRFDGAAGDVEDAGQISGRIWTEDRLRRSVEMTRCMGGSSGADSTGWGVTTTSDSSASSSSFYSPSSLSSSSPSTDDPDLCPESAVLPAAALSSRDYGAAPATRNSGNILFCGWPGNSFSMELILALDRKIGMESGANDGSDPARILVLNQHDPAKIEDVLSSLRQKMKHSSVEHAKCDPRQRHDLERVLPGDELLKFKGAVTLVDIDWFRDQASPTDERSADFSLTPASTLRMDALILTCQLNLRHMLRNRGDGGSVPGSQAMILISEKLSANETRVTRFEDRTRLPLGSSVNSSSFAAKVLAQEAILPGSTKIYNKLGDACMLHVVDTSLFAEPGEEVSYAELQGRAADMQSTLIGFAIELLLNYIEVARLREGYHARTPSPTLTRTPHSLARFYREPDGENETYVSLTLNPQGAETKNEKRIWNKVGGGSQGRTRLVLAAGDPHSIIKSDL